MRGAAATLLAFLLLLPALVACGDDEAAPSGDREPISYSRSGGIAGISEQLEIDTADEVSFSMSGEEPAPVEVRPELIASARSALEDVDFADVPGPTAPIPDDFMFTLVYGGDRAAGGLAALPDDSSLTPALAALNAIVEAARGADPG